MKYLCLYTSDFIDDTLKYQNYIIQAFDNQEYLNEKELEKSYTKATNNLELFSVWKESYEFHHEKQGIFENNIKVYMQNDIKVSLSFSGKQISTKGQL